MFIAALFTIARTWKQPKYPSAEEWITKMWNTYTVDYYSAIKNKIMPFAVTWIDLWCAALSCSVVCDSVTPWTVAHQAPLSVGILQARILKWVAMPSSRRQSNTGIEPRSPDRPAAAAAESHQSCLTLCDPIDGSPPGSPVPGILQARALEWVAISLSNAWKWKVKVKSLSSVRPSATPRTAAYQAPPSMGFSRQEYWSEVPLPSPPDRPRDCHIEWSQTEKDKYHTYCLYVESKKRVQMNLFTKQK